MDCPLGTSISSVKNIYDHEKLDRRWKFTCERHFDASLDETWECIDFPAKFEHNLREASSFHCASNYFLVGVKSSYSRLARDRRWQFKCCSVPGYCTASCELSRYRNDLHTDLSEFGPLNRLFTGVFSYYEPMSQYVFIIAYIYTYYK